MLLETMVTTMTKLEQLIEELCPDGVEYRKFSEIANYIRGITYGKSDEIKDNAQSGIPVLRANNITLGKNVINFDDVKHVKESVRVKDAQFLHADDILMCAGSGSKEHVGKVAYIEEKMNVAFGGFMAVIRIKDNVKVLPRYMFHNLTSDRFRKHIGFTIDSSTINNLNAKVVADFSVPVPPLPVQREIVKILDNFTELTAELNAELTAELTARKKQYEYYYDKLLDFSGRSDVPFEKLGDVCNVQAGGTPSKKNKEYWTNGTIKWLSSTVCKNKKSVDEVTDYITEAGLQNSSAKMMKKGTTLIALVGATIGKIAYLNFDASINQNVAGVFPVDTNRILPDYVYYICGTLYDRFMGLSNGKLAMANMSFVRGLEIPIPPIDEQRKIVEILERFESLCSDISCGLPAEIEARKKQYEYYRDKLLTFKEAI